MPGDGVLVSHEHNLPSEPEFANGPRERSRFTAAGVVSGSGARRAEATAPLLRLGFIFARTVAFGNRPEGKPAAIADQNDP